MEKLLGQGWVTSVLGYLVILLEVGKIVFTEQGLPNEAAEWFEFVGAILIGTFLRLSRDPAILSKLAAVKSVEAPKE
jgi:hypothetical protein